MSPKRSTIRTQARLAPGTIPRRGFFLFLTALYLTGFPSLANSAEPARTWADFVETDFPFFSSVLDARTLGPGSPADNLTPRGIILNLGNDCWACFDTDLLRMSANWHGAGVSPVAMAPGSHQIAGTKAPAGQGRLPEIEGTPWLANGIYPGWKAEETYSRLAPESASDPANFSAERWAYRRTPAYGSPHFRLDGSKGQEPMPASSAYLSPDRKTVFIGIPDMRPVMQMRLGWALRNESGQPFEHNAYFTAHALSPFDPAAEGFKPFTVDLTPRTAPAADATPITAAEGERIAQLMGCVACHSTDGSTLGKVGPSWKGLSGSERPIAGGRRTVADDTYLEESIREPAANIVRGFENSDTGMPSYEGVISDAQVQALVLYLKTL